MKERSLVYAAVLLSILSIGYWTAYGFNAYYTFHEYEGSYPYAFWYDIHYPNIAHGLQFLVFGQHIAPDQLLFLPFYYLYQSLLTLIFLQSVIVAMTSLCAFFVIKDLLKDSHLAFVAFLALLVNPGLNGLNVFDYHPELFIVLFSLLTFYFFMKKKTKLFFLFLALLLCAMEAATVVGMAIGLGLLIYSIVFAEADKKYFVGMSLAMIVISAFALLLYYEGFVYLENAYASGQYAGLPYILRAVNFYSMQTNRYQSLLSGKTHVLEVFSQGLVAYVFFALLTVFLVLGFATFFDPLIAIVMSLPWLIEAFVLNNLTFVLIWYYYMVFGISGTLIAGIIGLMLMKERKGFLAKLIAKFKKDAYDSFVENLAYVTILGMVFFFVALSPIFVYSKNVNNLTQDFLFQVSPQIRRLDNQLYSVMALVPRNSSLMTDYFILPHFADMRYLEPFNSSQVYFTPKYILFDFNLNISLNAYMFRQAAEEYLQTHKYRLYARNGTAYLFILSNNSTD